MRIIYKIKSSWDFISSRILIYLKRRWNSKMAISIKNHEDRITALEKKIVISATDRWTVNGNYENGISLTIGNFYIGGVFLNVPQDNISQIYTAYFPKEFITTPLTWVIDNNLSFGNTNPAIGWPETTHVTCQINSNGSLCVFGILKLYYNFSYNITREFYKVKFKLKHYLCSHLQKFI